MRILMVGGGSGGHVTPAVAVLRELKHQHPDVAVRFWSDKAFVAQARRIVAAEDSTVSVSTVVSGKLRRYQHLSLLQHIMIPSIFWPNIWDALKVLVGFLQATVKLVLWRPDAIFTKGGYVCLPVGWAAKLLRIPLVIHDSDAHPGLTNRLLARPAAKILTGAPLEYYSYPANKSEYVGIPVSDAFYPRSDKEKRRAKQQAGVDQNIPLVVVTGGGLGAQRMNDATVVGRERLEQFTSTILVTGAANYDDVRAIVPKDTPRFIVKDFIASGMADLLSAADIVVARAGATTLVELAALHSCVVLVPNARLTGGHQTKNAKVYEDAHAAILLDENEFAEHPDLLPDTLKEIIDNPIQQQALSTAIAQLARPDAAEKAVAAIISVIR